MELIKCACGKTPHVFHVKMLDDAYYHKYKIACECGLENRYHFDTKAEAIEAWNEIFKEKPSHDVVPARSKRLRT